MNKFLEGVRQQAIDKVNQYMDLDGINPEAITDLVLSIVNDQLVANGMEKILDLPETFGSLREYYEGIPPEYNVTIADRMRLVQAVTAAIGFKSVYLEERAEGCSHIQAAKKANSARRKIRTAFGYSVTHDISI